MSNVPAARTLGDVLAEVHQHRSTCAAENVPFNPERLLDLHTEALDFTLDLVKRLEALEAAPAKPAAKTTKAR